MSDFNIQFEEQDQSITLEFEQIGGGAVKSVNGKTGVVVLDADDVGAYVKPSGGIPASDMASGAIPAVDSTLAISGAAADAKKTGDEISDLKDGLTAVESDVTDLKEDFQQLNNGMKILSPYQSFENVLYTIQGEVKAYPNATTWAYKLENGVDYTVSNADGDTVVFGLSNNLYSGSTFTVGKTYNVTESNTTTFNNELGYTYLYITKSTASGARNIIVATPVEVKYEDTLKIAKKHLLLLYDSSDTKEVGYIKSDTGGFVTASGFYYTDYIDVTGLNNIVLLMPILTSSATKAGLAFYDSSKTYLSGVMCNVDSAGGSEQRIVTVPDNAVYMRTSCRYAVWNEFSVFVDDIYINEQAIEKLNQTEVSNYGMQLFEKIGVIGDSISVGWAKDKNGNNSRRNTGISWVQQMARRLGCTAYNLGASGVDPVEWFQPDYEFAEYCYTQYQSVNECNLYIIGLGLNPTSSIGSVSDINQSDYTQNAETFYGQYARIIQMINAEHPNAIVMCLTEPTANISNYDIAVRNICGLSYIKAELVDLDANYRTLFTTAEIEAEKQLDGLHYTPYGYSLIADAMMTALNDYISKNPTHFKYVGVAEVS